MSFTVKLYGSLREKVDRYNRETAIPSTQFLNAKEFDNIYEILKKFEIKDEAISHIFVNGRYCGLGKEVREGDRIGIFPRRMALIFAEIPHSNSIKITVKLFAMLRKYGVPKQYIEIPEGTTINSVLKKINLPEEEKNLILMVNGLPKYDRNLVLISGDILAIFPQIAGG